MAVKLTIATLVFSIASFLFALEIVRDVETEVFSSFGLIRPYAN
jgi:hypothetical protein